jgi:hypothetical protein
LQALDQCWSVCELRRSCSVVPCPCHPAATPLSCRAVSYGGCCRMCRWSAALLFRTTRSLPSNWPLRGAVLLDDSSVSTRILRSAGSREASGARSAGAPPRRGPAPVAQSGAASRRAAAPPENPGALAAPGGARSPVQRTAGPRARAGVSWAQTRARWGFTGAAPATGSARQAGSWTGHRRGHGGYGR